MADVPKNRRRLWIAAAATVALLAGVALAWAYLAARPGPADPIAQDARRRLDAIDRWAAAAEASVALATVRADVAAERERDGVERRVRQLADYLESAFAGGAAEEPDAWSDLQAALDRLAQQVRTNDPTAAETVAALDRTLLTHGP